MGPKWVSWLVLWWCDAGDCLPTRRSSHSRRRRAGCTTFAGAITSSVRLAPRPRPPYKCGVRDRILAVADVLMGAMHADGRVTASEQASLRHLLGDLLLVNVLPPELHAHLRDFRPDHIEVESLAAPFKDDPPELKRRLLEMVAMVRDADGIIDLAEDDYLRGLADAIGLADPDREDLLLSYEVEELRRSMELLRRGGAVPS